LSEVDTITLALATNDPMRIMEMGLSIAQGIDKIGPERCSMVFAVEQALSREISTGKLELPR
jgi:hypothetical protein